jgi:hypothetical protein
VVIYDSNILRIDPCPSETNAPLIVDADTEPTSVFAFECFEAIVGWNPQVTQSSGNLELPQLAPCDRFDVCKSPDPCAFWQRLSIGTLEQPDYAKIVMRYMNSVKRE